MKRMILVALALITACNPAVSTENQAPGQTLTIFAASSLMDAFTEIGLAFEQSHLGVALTFNFGGSQALRTQIQEGAQADVFASASAKEMDALVVANFVSAESSQTFASNQLVVILPADNPAEIQTLQDLATPGIKLVLAAEDVPAGNYARESLALMSGEYGAGFGEHVLSNLVSNEDNVKQVVTKVELGEADAGIVYVSDAVAAANLIQIIIPPDQNIRASYPIAPLIAAQEPDLAKAFIAAVLSPDGQAVLMKWGLLPR